jgi:hypothetical protein
MERLVFLSIALTIAASAHGQSITSIRDRAAIASGSVDRREAQVERRGLFRTPVATSETYVRLAPSLDATDGSTKVGVGMHLVSETPTGRGYFSFRPSYRTSRPRAADQDHVNGFGIGGDLQLNSNSNPFGQFIVSGDYARTQGVFQIGLATLEFDRAVGNYVTMVGTVSLARFSPESGDAITDAIPAVEIDFTPPSVAKVRLIATYTFTNNIDGEDDYDAGFRLGVTDVTAMRLALGKHGRVSWCRHQDPQVGAITTIAL